MTERLLVDFSYAQQPGHAIEALQCCVGHAAAVPGLELLLLGRLARDERSSTGWDRDDVDGLVAHRSHPVEDLDRLVAGACELLAVWSIDGVHAAYP